MTPDAPEAADTPRRILDAARDVLLREGLAALSMRKVAGAVGVSAPAIYRHFANKEAMLTEMCAEGFRIFGEYLFRGLQGTTPLDRLRQTGSGYLRFALEQPGYYQVMFMMPQELLGFGAMPSTNVKRVSSTFQFLIDRVRECIAEGDFAADRDPHQTAATIWSISHGLVALYLCGHFREVDDNTGFECFFAAAVDDLLRGLR